MTSIVLVFKMVDMLNGTAETIEHTLLDVCAECHIPTTSISSFGSDGVPVMTEKKPELVHVGNLTILK